ncbi:unnamed protein product [Discosporangium mesarthrocarpum]
MSGVSREASQEGVDDAPSQPYHGRTEPHNYVLRRPQDLRTEAIRRSGKRRPLFFGELEDQDLGDLSTVATEAIADALQKRDEWRLRKGEEVEWVNIPSCTPQKNVARSSTQDRNHDPGPNCDEHQRQGPGSWRPLQRGVL